MRTAIFFLPLMHTLRLNSPESDLLSLKHAPKELMRIPGKGAPIVWQRPKGDVKGILLFVHGCGGRATDMFMENGVDGHHLQICDAVHGKCKLGDYLQSIKARKKGAGCCEKREEEILVREKARRRGYLVVGVQGGRSNIDRCPLPHDIEAFKTSLDFIKIHEKLMDKPVIVAGFSRGGDLAPILVTKVAANCTIMGGASAHTDGSGHGASGFPAQYPKSSRVLFIHGGVSSNRVRGNLKELSQREIPYVELKADWAETQHYNYLGAYMDEAIDFCETGESPPTDIPKPLGLIDWQKQMGHTPFPSDKSS